MTGESGHQIVLLMKQNPAVAIPVILGRLREKDDEWYAPAILPAFSRLFFPVLHLVVGLETCNYYYCCYCHHYYCSYCISLWLSLSSWAASCRRITGWGALCFLFVDRISEMQSPLCSLFVDRISELQSPYVPDVGRLNTCSIVLYILLVSCLLYSSCRVFSREAWGSSPLSFDRFPAASLTTSPDGVMTSC
jgi:hypothetical protein